MKIPLEDKLHLVESYLRLGQRIEAQELLITLIKTHNKIPRKYLVEFSAKLRRSGLNEIAVKMLFPYVRRKGLNFKLATCGEREEYAASLLALGALEEAKVLLNELKTLNSSKTYLYLGFLAMKQWDYETAKLYFHQFLQDPSHSEYESLIGLVNLKACEVFLCDSLDEMYKLNKELEELIRKTQEKNFRVLYANLIEIQSQLLIKNQKSDNSREHLEKINDIINDPHSKENLFIQKWSLLSQKPHLNSDKRAQSTWIQKMLDLQLKAKAVNHGETIRDIDFHLAQFLPELINKIYFGSKSNSFRQNVLKTYPHTLLPYYWHSLNVNKSPNDFQFDYLEYPDLKPGSLIHRVLISLVSDFYQVQNKYSLIFRIFSNNFFNPNTSMNQFHQALNRTREWLQKHKIPFQILEQNSTYFLSGNGSIKLYMSDINWNNNDDLKIHYLMKTLKHKLSKKAFTSKDVISLLHLSGPRKAQRLLSSASKLGLIQSIKNGRAFYYSFTKA